MDTTAKTTVKPGSPKDAAQAFRATAENGAANAKEAFDKVSAATAEATSLMQDSYSSALKGAQDYNAKFLEFARTNTEATFEFAQKLTNVRSPSEFLELSSNHSRKQFETLAQQSKELTALAQKISLAAAEPLKAGAERVERAYN